jgi:hypothetical protein
MSMGNVGRRWKGERGGGNTTRSTTHGPDIHDHSHARPTKLSAIKAEARVRHSFFPHLRAGSGSKLAASCPAPNPCHGTLICTGNWLPPAALTPCDTHAAPWMRGLHELCTRRAMTALKVIHELIISSRGKAQRVRNGKGDGIDPPGRTIQPWGISK